MKFKYHQQVNSPLNFPSPGNINVATLAQNYAEYAEKQQKTTAAGPAGFTQVAPDPCLPDSVLFLETATYHIFTALRPKKQAVNLLLSEGNTNYYSLLRYSA